jgi:hypothetical protein
VRLEWMFIFGNLRKIILSEKSKFIFDNIVCYLFFCFMKKAPKKNVDIDFSQKIILFLLISQFVFIINKIKQKQMGNSNSTEVKPNQIPVPPQQQQQVAAAPSSSVVAPADRSQLGIIKSQKVNKEVLKWVGDSEVMKQGDDAKKQASAKAASQEKVCRSCCMLFGGVLSIFFNGMVSMAHTLIIGYRERNRLPIDVQRLLKHAVWMTFPAACISSSLHIFLAEAMWSNRRNSFGAAWVKAVITNTIVWTALIGAGTLFWRRGLRTIGGKWGNKLYYRYPIPNTNLETRLLEDPTQVWNGMSWSYWALGLMTGQLGYLAAAGAVSYNNRAYYFMSPTGPYAKACCPRWRREALAKAANMELPPTA